MYLTEVKFSLHGDPNSGMFIAFPLVKYLLNRNTSPFILKYDMQVVVA